MENLLKIISEQGVLGVIVALFGFVIISLFKLLMEEKDKRIKDSQEYVDMLNEPVKQIKINGDTQMVLLKQILEKINSI